MENLTTRLTSRDFKYIDMKKITIILSMVLAFCTNCQKAVEYDSPLALSAERNELSIAEGSTMVIVYANEAWTASLSECDWARIDRTQGNGLGQIIFSYDENASIARKAVLTVTSGAHVRKIDMIQKSPSNTVISFSQEKWEIARCSGKAHLPFSSLIPESETGNISVSVSEGCDWISGVSVFADEVMFDIARNTSGTTRTAVVTAAFTDVLGKRMETSATISQNMSEGKIIFGRSEELSSEATDVTVQFETNMGLFIPQILQSVKSNTAWCKAGFADRHKSELMLSVAQNETQASRQGRITLSYTDNEGNSSDFYYIILQRK